MSSQMLDIGLEIKILRERLKISSKDLAARVGLSQSQMSRLEKGQRRIDIRILHKISQALGVDPSFFFRSLETARGADTADARAPAVPAVAPPLRYEHVGKLVRSERRRKHLTVDDLASRVGRTKAFMVAFEAGRHALDPELAGRICRALRLPPGFFVEAQHDVIQTLESQVARLDRALAEAHRGQGEEAAGAPETGDGLASGRRRIPLFAVLPGAALLFDLEGQPVGEPDDFLSLPGFDTAGAFAISIPDTTMEAAAPPSFRDGDIVVFGPGNVPRSGDLALARLADDTVLFRQVFFEADGSVRLQPLNLAHTARTVPRGEVHGFWRLEWHLARV